jgi:hypothetical protein
MRVVKPSSSASVETVASCAKFTLQAIIRGKIVPSAVVHTDGWRGTNICGYSKQKANDAVAE